MFRTLLPALGIVLLASAPVQAGDPPGALPNVSVTRALDGRYEQRRVNDSVVVGVESFHLTVHPDGTRSLVVWNDLRERGSQMDLVLSVDPDFRAREAYARYWTAGKWRGSAHVSVRGRRLSLSSQSAGAPGNVDAEAPERLSIGAHPVSGDGWHIAAMKIDGNQGVARSFTLNPGGDAASPLLGQMVNIPVERVGRERVVVPAGTFDTQHFRLAGVSDYWITGEDWIVVKARVRDREFVLVSIGAPAVHAAAGFAPGPAYQEGHKELESVMQDLIAWLPGEWSSIPQIHYERTVQMPPSGEHENWYRSFVRIDAPQIGAYVFYGQINLGGRAGPLYPRSQILYKAVIDDQAGVIRIIGQGPQEAEKFVNLQDHAELWKQVKMRSEAAVKCDFIWRRQGTQIFGVLEGRTPERRQYGPRTCNYTSETGAEFLADAEWVLGPEEFWLYDVNFLGGQQFIGRADRTHIRLYRSRPYSCEIRDAKGQRTVDAYDRGFSLGVTATRQRALTLMLLRAPYPAANGVGLDDRLRMTLAANEAPPGTAVATAEAAAAAPSIALAAEGVNVKCVRAEKFGPMPATN